MLERGEGSQKKVSIEEKSREGDEVGRFWDNAGGIAQLCIA